MATPLIQPSFAAGELAPSLHARIDLAKYHVGLATCLNWFIQPQGGAVTRAGTRLVDKVISHTKRSRLIPFQFNTEQAYALEFGDLKMRVIRDGAYVLESAKTITGITQANPAVVTSNAHGFSNGDKVFVAGVVGMVQVNGRYFTVAGATANTFQLSGVDSSGYTAYSSGGTVARVFTLTTPYAAADLPTLKYMQSADTMTLTHPGYAPRDLTRSAHDSWSLSTITFAATQAAPTALTATPSTLTGSTNWNYRVTAINAENGEESLASDTATVDFKQEHEWNPASGDYIDIEWTDAAGADSYNVYKRKNGIYGYIGNASSGAAGFRDTKIDPDTSRTPPKAKNPFNAADKYPGCATYHEERRWFAGSNDQPQTLWATVTGAYSNMNTSNPTRDDDAITRTLISRQVNEIRHLVSLNVLIALTSGAEWKIWPGTQADVLTPAAFSAKQQSFAGCSHVPPIIVNDSLVFIQERGSVVRDLRYRFDTDGYAGIDLSVLSGHLFTSRTIEEWAFAQEPHRLIWAVRDDGVLLALAYLKDQEVYAWSRHVTDGAVESVCAIPEAPSTSSGEDVLYLIVRRTIGGQTKRYVERLQSRVITDVIEAWSVDCGLEYDGRNAVADDYLKITGASYLMGASVTLQATGHSPFTSSSVGRKYRLGTGAPALSSVTITITAVTDGDTATATLDTNAPAALQNADTAEWALLASTVSGLDHLEGKTVAILGDGNVFPEQVVSAGAVSLDPPCARIVVGLPYTCDLETLNIDAGQPTVQGRQKAIGKLVLRLEKSRGLKAGPDSGHLTEIKERSTEPMGQPIPLYTGDREVLIDPSWNSNGRVFIRQDSPLPATLLAVIPRVAVGD
jgi:hypothetical protein